MSRLPLASRDTVPPDQAGLFDELVKENGLDAHGIVNALCHVPIPWQLVTALREHTRFDSSLPADVVKIAILVAGRELDCQFLWNAHAESAGKAGVPAEIVEALRERKELPPLSEKHAVTIHYGWEIYRRHNVSHGTFSRARELFGERGVVELGLLYGTQHLFALLINPAEVGLRAGRKQPVLPVY
jgi:4-carboxymuconolactone decarboxylase